MVFLDFFEALLGYAEIYVDEVSEQANVTAMMTGDEQQADMTAAVAPEQTAVPSTTHSVTDVEQVSHTPCCHVTSTAGGVHHSTC